jgi:hypothetical protein
MINLGKGPFFNADLPKDLIMVTERQPTVRPDPLAEEITGMMQCM